MTFCGSGLIRGVLWPFVGVAWWEGCYDLLWEWPDKRGAMTFCGSGLIRGILLYKQTLFYSELSNEMIYLYHPVYPMKSGFRWSYMVFILNLALDWFQRKLFKYKMQMFTTDRHWMTLNAHMAHAQASWKWLSPENSQPPISYLQITTYNYWGDSCGHDSMVVWFRTTCAISV
jgi:hypothetical protein